MEVFWFILFALVGGILALVVFIYSLKKGHFEDVEEAKYQVFRDEE